LSIRELFIGEGYRENLDKKIFFVDKGALKYNYSKPEEQFQINIMSVFIMSQHKVFYYL
jgi:hypothetical protein